MANKIELSGGVSLVMLGLVFIALKLGGVINWSWWLVTLPFWIGVGLWVWAAVICILVFIGSIIAWAIHDICSKRK